MIHKPGEKKILLTTSKIAKYITSDTAGKLNRIGIG